jgi:hypothetical protein
MSQTNVNKAKGHQSAKKAGYYANQFYVTAANKARRAKRRAFLELKRAEKNNRSKPAKP